MSSDNKRNESFVFYLNSNEDENSTTPEPSLTCILNGEQEICTPCKRVILYPSFSDSRQGILGTLHCTVFRLIFVPIGQTSNHLPPFPTSKILCNFRHEVALANVHSVSYSSNVENKKFKPLTSFLQHSDQVALVKIFCKDFRVLTFDFKISTEGYKMLLNGLIKHAFPTRIETLISFPLSVGFNTEPNEWPSFDGFRPWELELKRLNVNHNLFRVTHVNECYRHIDSYPQFFVVPALWMDSKIVEACGNWCERRIPVWCWSSSEGCAIIRSAKFDTISEVSERNWLHLEHVVAESHSRKDLPMTIDVAISTKEIGQSSELLRKLCSIESPSLFFDLDARWYSEIEQTGWLNLVSKCLWTAEKIITHVVDDVKTVIIREATNSDLACVVSCLAQLCLDKFFRSLEGFHVLLEKEWMALAHPFGVRLFGVSRKGRHVDDEMAPVFLLFLDCVHQLCVQFPLEFEFSDYYLVALWDLALTGLSRTFLFNSLKEASTLNAVRLPHAWRVSSFYKHSYIKLFRNPVYLFVNGLAPLADDTSPMHPSSQVLRPSSSMSSLEFWSMCLLRWSAPSQVLRGGALRPHVEMLDLCGDISELLKEQLFVDVTLEQSSTVDKRKATKNQQLRRYQVSPLDLDAATCDAATSAFPYSYETLPVPDCLYTVPVRTDVQTQNTSSGTRSMLELTAISESTADIRRLSVARLAMESNSPSELNREGAALKLNNNGAKNNISSAASIKDRLIGRTGYSLAAPPPPSVINDVVCELQNSVRFRSLQPQQVASTPPLAVMEDDFFCNTSV